MSGFGFVFLFLDFGEVVFWVKLINVVNLWVLELKYCNVIFCLVVKIFCKSLFLVLRCFECDLFVNKVIKDNIDECVNIVLMSIYRKEKVFNVKCLIDV